jgi:hypothetical protein
MGILDLFRRKIVGDHNDITETRSSGTGYTAAIMAARASYIAGVSDLAELTGTVQACVSLWEGALAGADVAGTDTLDRATMAVLGRSLALRGEFLALITGEGLVPAADWDLRTRNGRPVAYRISISEAGGGRSFTALAGEVLHVRIGSDPVAPWSGTAPLRRASLSANLLHELESALRDTFRDAPVGSQVLPLPDGSPDDMAGMRAAIRGRHGSTLIIEGASQAAAAGMHVQMGQRREDLSPDLKKTEAALHLEAAKGSVAMAFGVLPAMLNPSAAGPVIREAQRHLSQWTLEPVAKLISDEASTKLGGSVSIDVVRPLQAFDVGAKARAVLSLTSAGVPVDAALRLVDVTPDGQAVA